MTDKKTYDEVMAERERFPLGKPRPYTPDHPNLLAADLAPQERKALPLWPRSMRIGLSLLALCIAGYAINGVFVDDLYLPGKRSAGAHFHGVAAVLICLMLFSVAGCLVATTFSRLDPLRKQLTNRPLVIALGVAAAVFMVAAMVARFLLP